MSQNDTKKEVNNVTKTYTLPRKIFTCCSMTEIKLIQLVFRVSHETVKKNYTAGFHDEIKRLKTICVNIKECINNMQRNNHQHCMLHNLTSHTGSWTVATMSPVTLINSIIFR